MCTELQNNYSTRVGVASRKSKFSCAQHNAACGCMMVCMCGCCWCVVDWRMRALTGMHTLYFVVSRIRSSGHMFGNLAPSASSTLMQCAKQPSAWLGDTTFHHCPSSTRATTAILLKQWRMCPFTQRTKEVRVVLLSSPQFATAICKFCKRNA